MRFDWRNDNEREIGRGLALAEGHRQIGVIAQEVEEILPEAVTTGPNGVKAVNYESLVAPLIEAIKEQQKEIAELKLRTNGINSHESMTSVSTAASSPINGWMIIAMTGVVGISGGLFFLGASLRQTKDRVEKMTPFTIPLDTCVIRNNNALDAKERLAPMINEGPAVRVRMQYWVLDEA